MGKLRGAARIASRRSARLGFDVDRYADMARYMGCVYYSVSGRKPYVGCWQLVRPAGW